MTYKEVTRNIDEKIRAQLWGRNAGRCAFDGCNRPLYKSPVTQEQGNISEVAHIWSFSEKGPRGWGPFKTTKWKLNELSNLMLMCHDCHKLIDSDKKGEKYTAKLLSAWKEAHENRVAIVAGVHPSKKSHVVLYGANIGEEKSLLQPEHAKDALFPNWYPSQEMPVMLSMNWEGRDDKADYWQTEAGNLRTSFENKIKPLIEEADPAHFSIFGLAPMPLLTLLGTLFTDKIPTQVYQLHREPQTWHWSLKPEHFEFVINAPKKTNFRPVLVISLSASINPNRITSVLGDDVSIWELTIENPHNDFLRSAAQLSMFRKTVRKLLLDIGKTHGEDVPLSIFPAMPVACAVELGRVRMPKADPKWIYYDQNGNHNRFVKALEIGGTVS